jgi:hypothetical protein
MYERLRPPGTCSRGHFQLPEKYIPLAQTGAATGATPGQQG